MFWSWFYAHLAAWAIIIAVSYEMVHDINAMIANINPITVSQLFFFTLPLTLMFFMVFAPIWIEMDKK